MSRLSPEPFEERPMQPPTDCAGLLIGCDTGGTFTDFVMIDPRHPERGAITAKLSSTPDDPSRAILEGIALLARGRPVAALYHATTVATNTLLEGTTGRVGYLVTEGFGDSLWLGRGDRVDLYSLRPHRTQPPLRPDDVWQVRERASAQGQALLPLEAQECARLRERLQQQDGLEAIAVCLLHSTLYPEHEVRLGQELGALGLPVFLSHRVAPSPGEYERGMTTLLAAALAPRIERYLARLEQGTPDSSLWIVHSAGGLLRPQEARQAPHRLALSGPAAGLRGALAVGKRCGMENLLTLDMGGTSTDVALCHGGELPYIWESEIEGFPLRAPSLEIHTVGAGGGSLAYRDAGGLLRVGPRSAGAVPGPACYGRGGRQPAVTDALCWAGYLPTRLGDEGFRLDREASRAVLERLGSQLELELDQVTLGILAVAVTHLALAVRKVSTGRGHDPSEFTLFPFGGAGPMLACQVAEALEMRRILVPHSAGVLSAWGALTAPWEREWSATVPAQDREDEAACQALAGRLRRQLEAPDDARFQQLVARRYRGQGEALVSPPGVDFHALHDARFGFRREATAVETTEVRWRCRGPETALSGADADEREPWTTLEPSRSVLTAEGWTPAPVFSGRLGTSLDGPFLHFSSGSTLYVARGWRAQGLPDGHLLLER